MFQVQCLSSDTMDSIHQGLITSFGAAQTTASSNFAITAWARRGARSSICHSGFDLTWRGLAVMMPKTGKLSGVFGQFLIWPHSHTWDLSYAAVTLVL